MKDLKTAGIATGSVIVVIGGLYFAYKKFVPENIKDAAATAIQYPAATRDIISGKRTNTFRNVEGPGISEDILPDIGRLYEDKKGGSRKRKRKHRKDKTKKHQK